MVYKRITSVHDYFLHPKTDDQKKINRLVWLENKIDNNELINRNNLALEIKLCEDELSKFIQTSLIDNCELKLSYDECNILAKCLKNIGK